MNYSYINQSSRLYSFRNWTHIINPIKLSEAGFFYTGVEDFVQCFSCSGILKDWDDENDDPWEQHALWLPNCQYLKQMKGVDYIQSVQVNKHEELPFHQNILSSDKSLCKICFMDNFNTIFLPCGHVVACHKCALSFTYCPICRILLTEVKRIFFHNTYLFNKVK